jgi:DNA helicase-2/ATP-dependent DNA helicase PcrA
MLLNFISIHRELGTRLTTVRPRSDSQVGRINLLTAHKAKGLEYDIVHIIKATDNNWGEKARGRSRLISYPANLPLQPTGNSYDERLRLFFVAMTRAKKQLTISYAKADQNAKPLMIASFLSEQPAHAIHDTKDTIRETKLAEIDWRSRLMRPIETDLKSLLSPSLEQYKLSITHLNNFLDVSRGGPDYFLSTNLLRFPQGKSPAASYGTAIHAVLSKVHSQVTIHGHMKPIEDIFGEFEQLLSEQGLAKQEFNDLLAKGIDTLNNYLSQNSASFTANQLTELSFAGQGSVIDGVRLTGALDLVDIDTVNKTIFVTDYKTGRPSRNWTGRTDYEKVKLHKYRQQLMFYQLLVKHSRDYANYQFAGARLQFVEPEKGSGDILALEDSFSTEELQSFKQLIKVVWNKIITLDLPDVSPYSQDYKGMKQFEQDLLHGDI